MHVIAYLMLNTGHDEEASNIFLTPFFSSAVNFFSCNVNVNIS